MWVDVHMLTGCHRDVTLREESNNKTYIFGIREQVHVLTEFAGNNYRKECENTKKREGCQEDGSEDAEGVITMRGNKEKRKLRENGSCMHVATRV